MSSDRWVILVHDPGIYDPSLSAYSSMESAPDTGELHQKGVLREPIALQVHVGAFPQQYY